MEEHGQYSFRYLFDEQMKLDRYLFDEQMKLDRYPENVKRLQTDIMNSISSMPRNDIILCTHIEEPYHVEVIFPGGTQVGTFEANDDGVFYKGTVLDEMLELFYDNGIIIQKGSVYEKTRKKV